MSPAKPRFLPHLPADFLAEHQLAGIRWSVQQAMKSPQYRAKLAAAGIACGEDIKTLDDVRRLPFSDVADLRDGYPLPLLCVEPSEVVRVHGRSFLYMWSSIPRTFREKSRRTVHSLQRFSRRS